MRIYVRLLLLIVLAALLPGGLVLLPLAYAEYRKICVPRATSQEERPCAG